MHLLQVPIIIPFLPLPFLTLMGSIPLHSTTTRPQTTTSTHSNSTPTPTIVSPSSTQYHVDFQDFLDDPDAVEYNPFSTSRAYLLGI